MFNFKSHAKNMHNFEIHAKKGQKFQPQNSCKKKDKMQKKGKTKFSNSKIRIYIPENGTSGVLKFASRVSQHLSFNG